MQTLGWTYNICVTLYLLVIFHADLILGDSNSVSNNGHVFQKQVEDLFICDVPLYYSLVFTDWLSLPYDFPTDCPFLKIHKHYENSV